jgi:membrane protease YdiL (CAAX protease family)
MTAYGRLERASPLDRAALTRAALLTLALAGCAALRMLATRSGTADGVAIGLAFGVALGAVALAAGLASGWRVRIPRLSEIAIGLAGGGALIVIALLDRGGAAEYVLRPAAAFAPWAAATIVVASAEEVLLRGSLFGALERGAGIVAAIALTTALFALMHVPFYGWQVIPLDVGVGLSLAGLRLLSGGVVAPAAAHALADLASWWL